MGGGVAWSSWLLLLLLTLALKGVLAGDWSVHLPSSPICAVIGSSVVLPCSYDYPNETRGEGQLPAQDGGGKEGQAVNVSSEMWCLEDSRCITPSYVFHSAGIFPDPAYQSRVQYLGQPGTKNCSLRISDLKESDSGTYVFYFITSHQTEKVPGQRGVQLLVAGSPEAVSVLASPSSGPSEGGTLHLACCSPAAGPQALFSWSRSSGLTHSGQVWDVTQVTPDQSGSYRCQIHTGDKVQNSSVLAIDVQYAPRNTAVSVWPPGQLQDHLPVNLTCSSDANPPVRRYTWYRGIACVPAADKSSHQGRRTPATPAGRGLSSASISVEEYGQHCCVARNPHGSQSFGVTLRSSREAVVPSVSAAGKAVLIAVTIGILLAIIAIAAFLISRRRKSSRHQSYVLAATTSPQS